MVTVLVCCGLLVIIVALMVRRSNSSSATSQGRWPGIRFSDLWRWYGTVDRGTYALVGVAGFALKHNLDRLVASAVFHRPWSLFNYLIPLDKALRVTALSKEDALFLATMVAIALPFIWVGVALTLRRLRAVGLPAWLVVVFFLPVVNLVFFLLLAVLPSRHKGMTPRPTREGARKGVFYRVIPEHPLGSAATALFVTVVFGLAATGLSISAFSTYGWGLFVGLPFVLGLISVLLHGYHRPRSYASCLLVSAIAVCLLGVGLLALAIEGVICLVMAMPLALALGAMGGSIGYLIQRRPMNSNEAPSALLMLMICVPILMGAEYLGGFQAPLFVVRTAVDIQTSPERVWRYVVAFSELPEPTEWLFRHGIAYPKRATIHGQGVGAERHCVFSTGAFLEPIEAWNEPTLLKFSVTQNPPPMEEWTPYKYVHPPHLKGFLVSEGGQFLLTPLSDGRTRLEGTTWYRHHMWPAGYWQAWSDFMIHQIHLRVLRHIKTLAESDGSPLG